MDIGIAYYPEHWPEERWDADFALMQQAGITLIRMAEFAWCRLEPREGQFDFGWLERAVALAGRHGIRSIICTPTEAPPPWLAVNYPETRPWTPEGLPYAIGGRRHVDPASPAFVHFSDEITRAMGGHFGRNPHVAGWQLDNEIGAHTHFVSTSPWCQAKFREWLRQKYQTVDALNRAWGLVFWSGEVREWSEVEIQTTPATGASPSYRKVVREFGQWLWMEFLRRQAAILRPLCPGQFITHNIAWYGEQLDIWRLHEFLDVVGIDAYQNRAEVLTAVGDLYHAAGRGKPWALLEMGSGDGHYATPEQAGPCTGWLTGALVKHALSGAKFVSLFRDQPSPSGCEQGAGAGIRDEAGRPSPTVQACAEAKRIVARLEPVLNRPRRADIALVCDTDEIIFIEMHPVEGHGRPMCNDFPRELFEIHHQLCQRGHRPTFASLEHDLTPFKTVFLWNKLLLDEAQAAKLRAYVAQGGTLIAGYAAGFFTRDARRNCEPLPFRLTDVFGCTVRDYLHVAPGHAPRLRVGEKVAEAARFGATLEPLGGRVLATWEGWTGEHRAAIVAHTHGKGRTLYLGALLERAGWDAVMPLVLSEAGLVAACPVAAHQQIELIPERGCWLVVNTGHEPVTVAVTGRHKDWVTGETVQGQLVVAPFGVALLDKC